MGSSAESSLRDSCDVDSFVTKLEPDGSDLVYSAFLGDTGFEEIEDVAVDASGVAHVAGVTSSADFPTTPGARQEEIAGSADSFVAKLAADGSDVLFSTFLGGSASNDRVTAIALDESGDVYLAGLSQSVDFPVTADALPVPAVTSTHAFFSRLCADGSTLLSSTRLGGSGTDGAEGVAVDDEGAVTIVGSTTAANFPTTPAVFQSMSGGGTDAFVTRLTLPEPAIGLVAATAIACMARLRAQRKYARRFRPTSGQGISCQSRRAPQPRRRLSKGARGVLRTGEAPDRSGQGIDCGDAPGRGRSAPPSSPESANRVCSCFILFLFPETTARSSPEDALTWGPSFRSKPERMSSGGKGAGQEGRLSEEQRSGFCVEADMESCRQGAQKGGVSERPIRDAFSAAEILLL